MADENLKDSDTMPILAPETVVAAPIVPIMGKDALATPAPSKEASWAISEYVKPSLIRYPQYSYKTGKQWFLSKTEKIVVDAYLKTYNLNETCRALNAIRAAHGSTKMYDVRAIKRWLQKPHVAQHLGEKFMDQGKVNWLDQPKWEAWGVDAMQGTITATQVQVSVWKEYGKAKGWYKDVGPATQTNMQINFVQSDGKA